MQRLLLGCLLAAFALMLFSFGSVFAQEIDEDSWRAYRPYDPEPLPVVDGERTITCESKKGRYNYCRTGTRGYVQLRRQLSERPCREYDTWGADGDGGGIWVADGCRGVFVVESRWPSYPGGWEPSQGGSGRTITCESRSGRYNYCRTGTIGRVRLQRQLSDTPCQEYYTWGADYDGSGIWVADGCRGVFVVEARRPPYPGGGGGGGRTIICKSEHYDYNHCRVERRGQVRLQRQLSDTRCIRGDNWGVDRSGIWVDRGCSAEFVIE